MQTLSKGLTYGQHMKQLFTLRAHNETQTLKYKQNKLIHSLIDLNNLALYSYFTALGTYTVL